MNRTKSIINAICSILILISILVFLTIGVLKNIWHPTWFIIPATAIVSAIIELLANIFIKPNSHN